jgi:N-glycosidase YbiA
VVTVTEIINGFTGEYRFLSNFHTGHPVTLSGVVFPTVEHYYQWSKCLGSDDGYAILNAVTPGAAKRAGQSVPLVPWWDECKRRIMLKGVTAKFWQHEELAGRLLATGNAQLIEGNTWGDTYWGVCDGVGTNYLGRILMVTRDALRLVSR